MIYLLEHVEYTFTIDQLYGSDILQGIGIWYLIPCADYSDVNHVCLNLGIIYHRPDLRQTILSLHTEDLSSSWKLNLLAIQDLQGILEYSFHNLI